MQTARRERQNVAELDDVFFHTSGVHTVQCGASERMRFVHGDDWSNFGGTFEFSDLNHFAVGSPYVFRVNRGTPHVSFRMHEISGFFQDNIRWRPDFNIGSGASLRLAVKSWPDQRLCASCGFCMRSGRGENCIPRGSWIVLRTDPASCCLENYALQQPQSSGVRRYESELS